MARQTQRIITRKRRLSNAPPMTSIEASTASLAVSHSGLGPHLARHVRSVSNAPMPNTLLSGVLDIGRHQSRKAAMANVEAVASPQGTKRTRDDVEAEDATQNTNTTNRDDDGKHATNSHHDRGLSESCRNAQCFQYFWYLGPSVSLKVLVSHWHDLSDGKHCALRQPLNEHHWRSRADT